MEIFSVLDVPQTQTVPICKEFFFLFLMVNGTFSYNLT